MNLSFLDPIIEAIDALGVRERTLILFAIIAIGGFLWWDFYVIPMEDKNISLTQEEKNKIQKVKLLKIQLGGITEESLQTKIANVNKKFIQKEKELNDINTEVGKLGNKVVNRAQLNEKVLQRLLRGSDNLRMANWNNEGNEEIFEESKAHAKVKGSNSATDTEAANISLNQDLVTIKFDGTYFAFLNYLNRIEHLGWQLFFNNIEYEVIEYPNAVITLNVGIPNIDES